MDPLEQMIFLIYINSDEREPKAADPRALTLSQIQPRHRQLNTTAVITRNGFKVELEAYVIAAHGGGAHLRPASSLTLWI